MRRQSFVRGALILTVAGFAVRFIGAGFRIILARIIGDEGIGLYQVAYPVYSALLAISTAGVPIAISKLISQYLSVEDYRGARRVFGLAIKILAVSGLFISVAMYLNAGFIAERVAQDARAYYPIVAISPAIFFVTIMSTFRGYFQGQQKMLPTALSQLFEQLARVVVSLALVLFLINNSLEWAAAGATFGAAAGAIAGLLVLLVIYFRDRKSFDQNVQGQVLHAQQSSYSIALSIFSLSIPITLSHLVMPIISLIDLTVVPMRLAEAGFDKASRMALYGQLTGMAAPLIHIPQIVTIALAVSLVPAISEALALNNRDLVHSRTSLAVRLSFLLGLPAAVGLSVLAEPISILLYKNAPAGEPLTILAYAVIFIALFQVTSGILQGMGKTQLPLIHLLLGSTVKLVLNWILIGIPSLNIRGAAVASVVGFALASLLNLYRVKATTGLKFDISKFLFRPLFAVVFMGLAVRLWYYFSMPLFEGSILALSFEKANTAATLSAIGAGMLLYFLALLVAGGIDREDLLTIPRLGPKILAVAEKLGFLKQ